MSPSSALGDASAPASTLAPATGLQLHGEVDGSGYAGGAAMVRRADGQMVQVGPLMFALLEELDGRRDAAELAAALCKKLGRACEEEHVLALADKLAEQGLLAGSEANVPARSNPLLALRWKVVVTDPALTRSLTAPFTWLFRPWVLGPVLAAFAATWWFVAVQQGLASGAAQAFQRPELILLLFVLGVASAAFHELGHAAACRVGGGTPGAMGAGIYLVWPAFYTDVTDTYRLPRRARLRTDLGGLYFNAIVAVATMLAWLTLRVDALLLLIALQLVEMVKQLSPVIRADGYHILSDVTGVPDLYAHIGPTLTGWLPGRRHRRSALTGRARVIVTLWVLVVVPVLLGVALSAVLLLPKLVASTWESGSGVLAAMSDQLESGSLAGVLVSLLRLLALVLPVLGAALIVKQLVLGLGGGAMRWSRDRPARRALVAMSALAIAGMLALAWWPDGQYEPIRASDQGTIGSLARSVTALPTRGDATRIEPAQAAASTTDGARAGDAASPPTIPPGRHLAVSLIPEGGATTEQPAIFVITDPRGDGTPIVITADEVPSSGSDQPAEQAAPDASSTPTPAAADTTTATAFGFGRPDAPGDQNSQALAINRTDGGITYEIAYSLVTVRDGADVDQRNGAHAYANCVACATVAVSFQVVLVVGSSDTVAPINIAEALNGNCPECVTLAIANQIVVSVGEEPSQELLDELNTELARLDAIDDLGADTTPAAISAQVASVQQGINQILIDAGALPAPPSATTTTTTPTPTPTDPSPTTTEASPTEPTGPAPDASSSPSSTPAPSSPAPTGSSAEGEPTTTSPTPSEPTEESTTTPASSDATPTP